MTQAATGRPYGKGVPMGDYRNKMSKGLCLANAILWTVLLAINLHTYVFRWGGLDGFTTFAAIVMALCVAVHWYRYLAYDKKQQEEQNHE